MVQDKLSDMTLNEILAVFREFGQAAKSITEKGANKELAGENYFGDTSIAADVKIEDTVKKRLKGCALITEERPDTRQADSGRIFVLDPLDGSKNYMFGYPAYTFAICSSATSRISGIDVSFVKNLVNGDEYHAIKGKGAFLNNKRITRKNHEGCLIAADFGNGETLADKFLPDLMKLGYIRMSGVSTLDMCFVADGKLDALFDVRDRLLITHAAGYLIMKEAGIIVTDKNGNEPYAELSQKSAFSVIAASDKKLHSKLLMRQD